MTKAEIASSKKLTLMQRTYLEKLNEKVGSLNQALGNIQQQMDDAKNDLLSYLDILREAHNAPKDKWFIKDTAEGFVRLDLEEKIDE